MFDFNSAKSAYDVATNAATKLFNLNTQMTQSYFTLQTSVAGEALNFALSSATKAGDVKTPKDLEVATKENQSQLQDLVVKNSKECLQLYKSYVDGVNSIVTEATVQSAPKSAKVAVAK